MSSKQIVALGSVRCWYIKPLNWHVITKHFRLTLKIFWNSNLKQILEMKIHRYFLKLYFNILSIINQTIKWIVQLPKLFYISRLSCQNISNKLWNEMITNTASPWFWTWLHPILVAYVFVYTKSGKGFFVTYPFEDLKNKF